SFFGQARAFFFQQSGDPAGSQEQAVQALDNLRQQQASSLAYFDVFWVAAVVGVALVFLVPLMKRSVAEKGAHVGAGSTRKPGRTRSRLEVALPCGNGLDLRLPP